MRSEYHKDPTSTEATESRLRGQNAKAMRPSRPPRVDGAEPKFPTVMRGGLTHRMRRMKSKGKITLAEHA